MGDLFGNPVVSEFHKLYMSDHNTWTTTFWRGVRIVKCPFDLWIYQEIIHETKPELIIECGTFLGGSALYFANLMDLGNWDNGLMGGTVLTIDVAEYSEPRSQHVRITYLRGSSVSPAIFVAARSLAKVAKRVMVVLDSDHSAEHVFNEMSLYSDLVTPGCYMVVEDTDNDGPRAAVAKWMESDDRFIQDRSREKNLLTLFPGGWLKRK